MPNTARQPQVSSAVARLDDNLSRELRSTVASAAMEGTTITPAEQEILALYLLGEITSDEQRARLMAHNNIGK